MSQCETCNKNFCFKFIKNLHQKKCHTIDDTITSVTTSEEDPVPIEYGPEICDADSAYYMPQTGYYENPLYDPPEKGCGYSIDDEDLNPNNNPIMFKKKMESIFKKTY